MKLPEPMEFEGVYLDGSANEQMFEIFARSFDDEVVKHAQNALLLGYTSQRMIDDLPDWFAPQDALCYASAVRWIEQELQDKETVSQLN